MATDNGNAVMISELPIQKEELESFSHALTQYLETKEKMKELEAEQKAGKERLLNFLALHGLEKAQYEAYTLSYRVQERRTINREKLLRNGVRPDIIARSEDVTQFAVLDVRERKRKLSAGEAMLE